MPSLRFTTNTVIWAVAFLLQCVLVVVVFRHGIARRYPAFAALLIYQPLRAALMFGISRRVDAELTNALSSWGSFADVTLQFLVAIELAFRLMRSIGGWTLVRGAGCALILGAAFLCTRLTLLVLPHRLANSPMQLLAWFVLLALATAVAVRCRHANLLPIAAGMGAFSVVQFAAIAGRSIALIHRNGAQYFAWSYLPAIGYIGVVIFWIVTLQNHSGPPALPERRA